MRELELMGTLGCHLCELAVGVIVPVIDPNQFVVFQVDIAEDDALMEQYAIRIPVLVDVETQAALDWPFDQETLQQFLASLTTPD